MSFTYTFPDGTIGARIVGRGKTTVEDCQVLLKRVLADPRHHPETPALIDIRDASYAGAVAELLELAGTMENMACELKGNIAIVAKGATLFVAELLAAHVREMEHVNIRVFVSMAAAKKFSGC